MQRLADNIKTIKGFTGVLCLWSLFLCLACSRPHSTNDVDRLNQISYSYHYKNIDSAAHYARQALLLADNYPSGKAEAMNNLAFVDIIKMNYGHASTILDSIPLVTNNQIELLVADIQQMRLCQRQSKNKEFYSHKERANKRLRRINEERGMLSKRTSARLLYAESELSIVTSTYYYYVGLNRQSMEAIRNMNTDEELQHDTAQYLNLLYQRGSGDMIEASTHDEIIQHEYELLLRCFLIAHEGGFFYWEANALQSLSEHMAATADRNTLFRNNPVSIGYINTDYMPDSLLSGYLAQRSLEEFIKFGDVYQTAGSFRTLAQCYREIDDYTSSLICLNNALSYNKAIQQAPDLVASIHEQLSIVYSAMGDKYHSDINRNKYLDLQERTRQDKELDARATQLEETSQVLNTMICIIILLIAVLLAVIGIALRNRTRHSDDELSISEQANECMELTSQQISDLSDSLEELDENRNILLSTSYKNEERNISNRAKIFLVDSVMPLIDRMVNEVRRLQKEPSTDEDKRYEYIAQLAAKIEDYNAVLTQWIQLRQGDIGLRIESFSLASLLDTIAMNRMSFTASGIALDVQPTDAWVKGDKALTLFMINTLADNARKSFISDTPSAAADGTQEQTCVRIYAEQKDGCVEISVADNGCGMSEEQLAGIFNKKIANGHGFGLLNCRGIMDKYRKVSHIFDGCSINAESTLGKGSRFFFRLPCGIAKMLIAGMLILLTATGGKAQAATAVDPLLTQAKVYADSAYFSNVNGSYSRTLLYADSARQCLNQHYRKLHPGGQCLMTMQAGKRLTPAEIEWYRGALPTDYNVILDIRNESAIAALALHQWDVYKYNNDIYTQLFKDVSADRTLGEYCRIMQKAEFNKNIAICILLLLLVVIASVGYALYYRNSLRRHHLQDTIQTIRNILQDTRLTAGERLQEIKSVDTQFLPTAARTSLTGIVNRLSQEEEEERRLRTAIEQANEDIAKLRHNYERTYVCNNVIENCLSTIKHETMYYPSKIKHYAETAEKDLQSLAELLTYYKQLYAVLAEQAHRQTTQVKFSLAILDLASFIEISSTPVVGNSQLLRLLFDIIKRQNKGQQPHYATVSNDITDADGYITIAARLGNVTMTQAQCSAIFVPSADTIPYLICRQIVREHAQAANRFACGITADTDADDALTLRITLPVGNISKAGKTGG